MKGNMGYKTRTIICATCDKTVTGHLRPKQRYCSLECYRRSARPQRKTGQVLTCAVCGAPVYIPVNRLGQPAYFCSKEHANQWQARNKTEHVCKVCGKTFRWSPSRQKAHIITYCSLACRDADPERRAHLVAMNAAQQRLHPNTYERGGYAFLDSLDIAYERQHLIGGKFCVDAFVPDVGLVIQFDGDYWHGNPARFPNPDARQCKQMRLDKSQDAYMEVCRYRVFRIWQSEFEGDPQAVMARLQPLLSIS